MVVRFVFLLDSPEDGDGIHRIRFIDHHRLEPPLERFVLLEIFLVFLQGRCANDMQFPPGKRRLEDIGGVHGPFARAGPDQGMDLVDEQDDLPFSGNHFLNHAFQPFLEFSLEFGPGDQGPHIKGKDLFGLQVFRYIPVNDPVGESFGNGGLSHAGFPDEDRVILRSPGKDLQHPADLFVTTDDRIEFSGTGKIIQVPGVFIQGIVGLFSVLAVHRRAFPQLADGSFQVFFGNSVLLQQP